MAIFIRNSATEAKIRKLAKRTGLTLTAAVDRAVDAELAIVGRSPRRKRKGRIDRKKVAEIFAYFDSLPKINERLTDDEIIGYDEHGLPN